MSENISSGLRFIDYNVNDIVFHSNRNFEDRPVNVKFNIDRQVEYLEDEENTILIYLRMLKKITFHFL